MSPCRGEDRRFESGRARIKQKKDKDLPRKEAFTHLKWKHMRQKLDLPESYISITLGFLVVLVAGILSYNYFIKNQIQKTVDEKMQAQEELLRVGNVSLPTTYKVAPGDNLWKIAEKHYNSGYNWVTLAEANNLTSPDKLETGQEINIPKAEPIRPGTEILATEAPPKEYSVIAGDSLWKIAEREYGSGFSWTKIAESNSLANPNIIHTGSVLKLPRL